MRRFILPLLLILLTLGQAGTLATTAAEETEAPPRTPEISPALELLSGVLAHTTWMQRRGPQGDGNTYFRALKQHFDPHRQHASITLVESLLKQGFTYDAHVAFALCLGALPDLELCHPYPDTLLARLKGNKGALEELRVALRDVARESEFEVFLKNHAGDYLRWSDAARFDQRRAQHWLETFFGQTGREYHVVLAPAMFPGGGYGVTLALPDGSNAIFQVVRAEKFSTDEPQFGHDLERLSIHEWGHAFVNPAVSAHRALVNKLAPHFASVSESMRKQAYGTLDIYANEQVLRACEVLAAREFHGTEAAERLLRGQQRQGFLLTATAVRSLERYLAQRDQFPDFASFVPTLLEELAAEPVSGHAATLGAAR